MIDGSSEIAPPEHGAVSYVQAGADAYSVVTVLDGTLLGVVQDEHWR